MLESHDGCSSGRSTGTSSWVRVSARLVSTARKLTVLSAKQTATPKAATITPAAAGPTTREALKRLALSAPAFGSSSRPTIWKGGRGRGGAEEVGQPDDVGAADGEHGERRCDDHRRGLRDHHLAPVVEAVGDDAGDQPEDRERREAAEGQEPDGDGGMRQLDHVPGKRDVLHPGTDERDHL